MLVSIGFFFIAMVLAGGLVALIADKLGRTLGKKRLTLLGMRPRHTATTITVVAGMLIPLFTILLLTAASQDMRDLIEKAPTAIAENDRLSTENKNLQGQKSTLTSEVGGLKMQRDQYQTELSASKEELAARKEEMRLVTTQLKQVQTRSVHLTLQVKSLQNRIAPMQLSMQRKQVDLQRKQAELAAAEQALSALTPKYESLTSSYQSLKTSYDEINRQREEANKEYVKVTGENDQLAKLNTTLRDENQKASTELEKTSSELTTAKASLAETRALLNRATIFTRMYAKNIESTRMLPIIFKAGDEVARITIPKESNTQTVKGLYASLIRKSVATAKSRGAKAEGEYQEANLIPRPDEKGVDTPPEKQEEKLVEIMTNNKENLVLISRCSFNTFLEEWVALDLRVYRNPTIYRQNDKVAEIMINGTDPEATVIQGISDFLTKTVKPKAMKDGMIPVTGNDESLGELSLSDVVDLAKEIRDRARPIRLAAFAESDTRAADPLRLSFRVR